MLVPPLTMRLHELENKDALLASLVIVSLLHIITPKTFRRAIVFATTLTAARLLLITTAALRVVCLPLGGIAARALRRTIPLSSTLTAACSNFRSTATLRIIALLLGIIAIATNRRTERFTRALAAAG